MNPYFLLFFAKWPSQRMCWHSCIRKRLHPFVTFPSQDTRSKITPPLFMYIIPAFNYKHINTSFRHKKLCLSYFPPCLPCPCNIPFSNSTSSHPSIRRLSKVSYCSLVHALDTLPIPLRESYFPVRMNEILPTSTTVYLYYHFNHSP